MSRHIEIGNRGEDLAAHWLVDQGFTILHRNWRHGRFEVDIIAGSKGVLHIIEVKTRRSTTYGHPEESVNRKKIEHILRGASAWLHKRGVQQGQWPGYQRVQYDVLAVTLSHGKTPEIVLFEDVYL